MNVEELTSNTDFYKSNAIFNPVSAKDLDPKDPELLNKMFEPYIFESGDQYYRLNVSKRQPSRKELDELEVLFEGKLKEKQARKSGICPTREQLHKELFDEIIRQATLNLPERGLLLMRVRDNLKMTFAGYQTLYEGSLVFGSRKVHVAETGVSELETRLD
jgi:dynein light intermediate chain